MTTIAEPRPVVTGGVDTQDMNVAAVVTAVGGVLGTEQFPTTAAGYRWLLAWMRGFGEGCPRLGRRRGGFGTKFHLLTDGRGIPPAIEITAGHPDLIGCVR